MAEISGQQRLQLTIEWIKRGKQGDRENFIKRVCEIKQITYIPPPKLERPTIKKVKKKEEGNA